jgi:hypothetical protein
VLAEGIRFHRKHGSRDYRLDRVEQRGDRVVVAFSWADRDGRRHDLAQALTLKQGKIFAIQDYASPMRAFAVLRVRAAFA